MVSWVPYSLIIIVRSISDTALVRVLRSELYVFYFESVCYALMRLNTLCDALIYAVRLEVVRQGYKTIFRKICKKFVAYFSERTQKGHA